MSFYTALKAAPSSIINSSVAQKQIKRLLG